MTTKIVYVLTSNTNDYYLEQAILSMYSLRMHNPNVTIILVTDQDTANSFTGNRKQIYSYISKLICVKVPAKYDILQKSRYLKTTLRKQLEGDYLYIDTDTIIADDISEIDDFPYDVAAVLDKHLPIQIHMAREYIRELAKQFEWEIPENGNYFNSGVMYVKDSQLSHKLYDTWHKLWQNGIDNLSVNIDQPSLAKANEKNGYLIHELNGIYNCQLIENGLKYLFDAKIIHYFAANIGTSWDCPYLFRESKLYAQVREYGITEEIHTMLSNAKSAFHTKCTIIAGNQADVYGTPLAGIARRLSRRYPFINKILRGIIKKYNY